MSVAVDKIKEIAFGVLSPEKIRKLSVVEVTTPDTYDESGLPLPNGLMDPRMGSLEPGQICPTCKGTAVRCPGHFGHIELAEPIVHVGFVKAIKRILDSFCANCGRIALPEKEALSLKKSLERRGVSRTYRQKLIKTAYVKARAATRCPHCGAVKNKIEFQKPYMFSEATPEGEIRRLTAAMIKERFERLHTDDLPLLGIDPERAHPKWYILEVLPVPPLTVRPSIILETGLRSEDDLTHKLVDIVMINQRIKENKESGAPSLLIYDLVDLLQYHVTTFFDNRIPGIPQAKHRGGRPLRTISQRLSGKEGRFRLNLSGKRVNFSARSVISPDSNLELNEVGVPIEIAMKLTVPMRVTPWNLELAKKFVKNGPFVHPGANYVIRPDGKRIRLDFVPDREALAEALQPGFIVERHVMDGDVALFNRQPSLHRMSMMAHYVKVLPGKTLRLHLSVCPPYNADFDGDEMNLHIVRSEEAIAEAKTLMAVEGQIISPRYGAPLVGGVRDHISGLYLLTRRDTLLTAEEACMLLYAIDHKGPLPEPAAYKDGEPLYSGKSIFSLIIPKSFTYSLKASVCRNCPECKYEECEYDAYVVIRNGVLEKGVIDKASIGAEKTDSILHRIVREYGSEVGREFLTKAVKLSDTFLRMRGFSMSYSDLKVSESVIRDAIKILRKASRAVNRYVDGYLKGDLEPLKGYSLEESLELRIMDELSRARDKAGECVLQRMEEDNSLVVMVSSGARGSLLNISQLAASVGQQSIRGKRIHRGYKGRTLTFFKMNDLGALARGFVFSSFRDGLNPIEFFFHAMGGREGIVDTAVRTQQSGYLQRRLINALTNLRVEYDLSVRTNGGRVVQFIYGEDGIDPAKSDHGKAVNVERLVASIKLLYEGKPPASHGAVEKILSKVRDEIPPKLFEEVKAVLKKYELSENAVKEVVNRVVKSYKESLIEPGLAVGVVAAQSIGEPGTQMTLRTFHFAGVRERNVTLGLPRVIEIVDARKEPTTPSMVIYLKDGRNKSRAEVEILAKRIVATRLKDLTVETSVDLLSQSITFTLDEGELAARSITADDIASKLRRSKSFSVQITGNKLVVKAAGFDYLKLLKLRDRLLEKHISGVPGIERITVALEGGEWVMYTVGSNLKAVLELPEVDEARTKTNDIMQIASVLGIEAARNAIVEEIVGVLNEQGLDVDVRHVMLVADVMTLNGEVKQIGRYGVVALKESVLARAAYETTVQTLLSAAVAGEVDDLSDVVSSIIVGQTAPVGTGFVDLLMEIGGRRRSGSPQKGAG